MSGTLPKHDAATGIHPAGRIEGKCARRSLWLVLCLTLPLPYWIGTPGLAPPARLLFVSTLFGGIALGASDGPLPFVVAALLVQAAIGLGLMYLVARLLLRFSAEGDGTIRLLRLTAIALALIVVSLLPIYHIPLGSSGIQVNLLGLFG